LMGAFSGTCPMMEKIATTIGNDISRWVDKAGRHSSVIAPAGATTVEKPVAPAEAALPASAAEPAASTAAN
jgi:hypothetical protein